jgi:hypothetical protein
MWHAHPGANIGLALKASGLVAVDVDPRHGGDETLLALLEMHGRLPRTVQSLTGGGGVHFLFNRPGGELSGGTDKLGPGVDMIVNGYIVVPPSNHAAGHDYRWAAGRAPGEVPVADAPQWVVDAIRKHPPVKSQGGGERLGPEDPRTRAYVEKALENELASVRNAREHGRNTALNTAALKLGHFVGGGYLSRDEFVRLLTSAGKDVGLDGGEIPATIESGLKKGESQPRVIETTNRGDIKEPPFMPVAMTMAELMCAYPHRSEVIVQGLIARGEVGNIISGSKLYKSWFMMQMGLALVTGQCFLGFKTWPSRVLMIDYELPPGDLVWRLGWVAEKMGTSARKVGDRLQLVSLRGQYLDIDGLGLYFATLAPRQFDCVIVGPRYRTYPTDPSVRFDENSNAAIAGHYAKLQRFAEELGAALFVVHHLTKGNQSEKSITDQGAGAGAQSRACDCHLTIQAHAEEGAGVVAGVLRTFPPFKAFCIRREFDLWALAPDLDPRDVRGAPGKRPAKGEDGAPAWTAKRFAAEILTEKPQARDAILNAALEAGVPNRSQARQLLIDAGVAGWAHRWRDAKDERWVLFANRPQGLSTPVDSG